jgi:hypothetical protein
LQVVLVTEKRRTSPMYKSLSQRYASPPVEFAEVLKDSESAALLAQYGVTKAPTLLAITADRQTLTYNGGWVRRGMWMGSARVWWCGCTRLGNTGLGLACIKGPGP